MRKAFALAALVAALFVATPAIATTTEAPAEESLANTATVIATVGALALVTKSVTQAVRRRYPALDGTAVQVVAWVLASGFAMAIDLRATSALLESIGATPGRTPIPLVDYIVTGAAVAAGAGWLAEQKPPTPPAVEIGPDGTPL